MNTNEVAKEFADINLKIKNIFIEHLKFTYTEVFKRLSNINSLSFRISCVNNIIHFHVVPTTQENVYSYKDFTDRSKNKMLSYVFKDDAHFWLKMICNIVYNERWSVYKDFDCELVSSIYLTTFYKSIASELENDLYCVILRNPDNTARIRMLRDISDIFK